MRTIAGILIGLVIVVPIGALIAQRATLKFAKFKPRYSRAILSTVIAYIVAIVIGQCLAFLDHRDTDSQARGVQFLGFGIALACAHSHFLPSGPNEQLSGGKAILVATCQVFGALIALFAILGLAGLVKHLVT